MANYSRHASADATQRGMSSQIFGEPTELVRNTMIGKGLLYFDDFVKFGSMTATNAAVSDSNAYAFLNTGVSLAGQQDTGALSGAKGGLGVLEMSGNVTSEDQGFYQAGTGETFSISNASGSAGPVCFECRVKKASIADNTLSQFIGLGGGPVADAHLVDSTGALSNSFPFIGFSNLDDDGDQWDFVYKEAAQVLQTILANAVTIVANTYTKLGFRYDPNAADDKKIKIYVNGVEQGTYVNTTQIDTATFPEDSAMCPMWLTKATGVVAESKAQVDWMAAYIGLDE